jgi:hypothetical protein
MARILAEKTESSFAPSHSFRKCTTFWRGTTREQLVALDSKMAPLLGSILLLIPTEASRLL